MVKDFEELVLLCNQELQQREYNTYYCSRISKQWENLREWMLNNDLTEFSEEIGNRYCDEVLGTHLMPRKSPASFREKLRSVRMLISYQKSGEFEFRCPSVEYVFDGQVGATALRYLEYCRNELLLSKPTIDAKRQHLRDFSRFMNAKGMTFDDLSIELTEEFFMFMGYSLASRHLAAGNIRRFLRYVYDENLSLRDNAVYILPDNYKKDCKLPTTYEEDEIRELVASVERASAIGKRDYLVLLLATEYGWRAKDITGFCFENIDWDNNVIRFPQKKTDYEIEFPLLSTVGNAIIDYLRYARPESDAPEIILSMDQPNKGKPLSSPTVHSIVTKYMKRAGIKDWQKKKHGPHAMRHSLATNLLKKNVAMPIISTVMGHQRTETTSLYISVDYDKLKQCALPMPTLRSPFYRKEGCNGNV